MTDGPTCSRRRIVAIGAATVAGLAGCASAPTGDDVTLDEPAAVPEGASCAVCNMVPAKFPDYNAQLTVEAGDRVFFCSSGCMAAYYVAPGHFEAAHEGATFVGVWAHDHATTDLIDATTAWFVRETDADRVDDPMRLNPLPFAAEADARAYVDEHEGLSAADVLRLEDFDAELARFYRARFFD